MKTLITITEETFGRPNPPDTRQYRKREAARAVLMDENDGVYLLYVSSQGYHKLPGGGIEKDESIVDALKREVLEETGCKCSIVDEIGLIVEFRHYEDESLEQYSYGYLAKQIGKRGEQALEEGEIHEGHDLVVCSNIDEAICTLENDTPQDSLGHYIRLRDLTMLQQAKKLLEPRT